MLGQVKGGGTMKKLLVILCAVLFLMGCAIDIGTSKVCSNIPQGQYSVLCDISAKVGTTPEAVGTVTKVANLFLLGETHTAKQAYDFIGELQAKSKDAQAFDGATYDQIIDYATAKWADLPPKVQAAMEVIKAYYGVKVSGSLPKLLSQYDWSIIDQMLADQKAVIAPLVN